MDISFFKMHGAGNDFILVDDRDETFPIGDRAWMERIAARRTGVGCEGIILIQPSKEADFRMRFINPDGGEVEMCGNGARCVARLAHELGVAPADMHIQTVAGTLRAQIRGESVRLGMTPPRDWSMNRTLDLRDAGTVTGHSVNTGVPHFVADVTSVDAVDVDGLGRRIRRHTDFAPAGTNANFFEVSGRNRLRVRTYERGVEAETLACGTGIVACGLVAARLGRVSLPVTVIPASGDELQVGGVLQGETVHEATLTGPAVHVYRGILTHAHRGA